MFAFAPWRHQEVKRTYFPDMLAELGQVSAAKSVGLLFKRLFMLDNHSDGFLLRTKANTLTQVSRNRPILVEASEVTDQMVMLVIKHRMQIELIFMWLKQNLAVKHFFSNKVNAVKSQIWCFVCPYLVMLITITRMHLPVSPQILLHLTDKNFIEDLSLDQLVKHSISVGFEPDATDQLNNLKTFRSALMQNNKSVANEFNNQNNAPGN